MTELGAPRLLTEDSLNFILREHEQGYPSAYRPLLLHAIASLARIKELEGELDQWQAAASRAHDEIGNLMLALQAAESRAARLEEALTPSDETKAAYMGQFTFTFGEYAPNVPWVTIKKIMAAILARAALAKDKGEER